jgi:hypothetical protein
VPDVFITSFTTVTNANPIKYSVVSGSLPIGLKLLSNGMIVGRPSFQNSVGTSTITVQAAVGTNSNSLLDDITFATKTFTVDIANEIGTNPTTDLYMEFLLRKSDRKRLHDLVYNDLVVPTNTIYREDDFYFGRYRNNRILVGFGMDEVDPDKMQAAMSQFNSVKSFLFTGLGMAQSLDRNGQVEYEVIYAVLRDEYTTKSGLTVEGTMSSPVAAKEITVDTTNWSADTLIWDASFTAGPGGGPPSVNTIVAYPSSVPNIIQQLRRTVSDFNSELLPDWMTSLQEDGTILGYVPVMPLVYCNPGMGKYVLNNMHQHISKSGNGLNLIGATMDRYVWDMSFNENQFVDPDDVSTYIEFPVRTTPPGVEEADWS